MDIEGHTNVMRYCLMGFIFPFKVLIWEMLPALHNSYVRKQREYVLPRMCGWKRNKHMDCTEVSTMSLATVEGVAPNSKMRPTKDELETDYYKRFLKYCSGKCVPDLSPPRHKKYKT